VAFVQNRMPRRQVVEAGAIVTGTVVVTFPLPVVPATGDMLLPDGEQHVVTQVLQRASQPVDNRLIRDRGLVGDERPPKLLPAEDRLLYPEVLAVEYLASIGPDGELLHLRPGHDWRLDGDRIAWQRGRGPGAGETYTVRYRAPAAYLLNAGEPVARAGAAGTLPYRAQGHRLDRWSDPDQGDAP